MEQQKRRFTRFPTEIAASCEVKGATFSVKAQNLSFGGLFVSSAEPFVSGTLVKIRFRIGEAEEIELRGYVRHIEDRGAGLEFIEVLPHQQAKLSAYITSAVTGSQPSGSST